MEKVFNLLSKSWFLVVFVISMVLWYADTNNKIQTVFAQQEEQKAQIDKILEVLEKVNDMKTDIAVIKNDVASIKQNLR